MELKDIAWNNALVIKGLDPAKWRMDVCGARIYYDRYNEPNMMFGWQIDHIFPQSALERAKVPQDLIDHPDNIRALNCKNNNSKSDNYPLYQRSYIWSGGNNVEIVKSDMSYCSFISVGLFKQDEIKQLYKDYIKDFKSGDLNV